jgi:hypothetical protein
VDAGLKLKNEGSEAVIRQRVKAQIQLSSPSGQVGSGQVILDWGSAPLSLWCT